MISSINVKNYWCEFEKLFFERIKPIDDHDYEYWLNLKNLSDKLTPANIRPYGKWFESHFPNEKMSCISYTGIILVSKEDILKRPKEFYINLLNEHLFENAEVVHYTERSWKNIFSISNVNKL